MVGDAIGGVPGKEFTFEVFDKTPIRQKPRAYPPHQREWVRRYCEKQVRMGVYRKIEHHLEPDPVFVSNSILVAKGQS